MESPASRLLALLSLLQAKPRSSASELAERLGVTGRTVRRDITRLRDLGYPVTGDPGPLGGYELGAGGALPPLLLTDDEAVAVALGLRAAARGGVAGFEDAAIAALAKLEQVLPSRLRQRIGALTVATVSLRTRRGPEVDPDLLLTLAQGCRYLERLRFEYRDKNARVSERRVEPFRLVNTDQRWYLVARDVDRDDWRTFRVDRMQGGATLTGHRFVRLTEPDAAAMVADGMALAPYPWQARVLLRADLETASDSIARTVGSLVPTHGGTLLRFGADDLEWMARYLVALPFDAEVLDPPELRETMRALGRRVQSIHPN
jgi:predicted DNA-binding transcriptional regulator YafY